VLNKRLVISVQLDSEMHSVVQTFTMNDPDNTPRYNRKRQDHKKQKRLTRQRCKWTLWVPVSILVLLAVCVYLKDHPSDVAHWGHISAVKTSEQNLTYYYKVCAFKQWSWLR